MHNFQITLSIDLFVIQRISQMLDTISIDQLICQSIDLFIALKENLDINPVQNINDLPRAKESVVRSEAHKGTDPSWNNSYYIENK